MKMQAVRGMVGSYGSLRRGQVADVDDHLGSKLVAAGRAIQVDDDTDGTSTNTAPASAIETEPVSPPPAEPGQSVKKIASRPARTPEEGDKA